MMRLLMLFYPSENGSFFHLRKSLRHHIEKLVAVNIDVKPAELINEKRLGISDVSEVVIIELEMSLIGAIGKDGFCKVLNRPVIMLAVPRPFFFGLALFNNN